MMPLRAARVLTAGLLLACGVSWASESACPSAPGVTVEAAAESDATLACDGAARALELLARSGLTLPRFLPMEVVEHLPGTLDGNAVGAYVSDTGRVYLLSYAAFRRRANWFGVAVEPELYRAAASHEVAHASVVRREDAVRLSRAAHEYVAYVTLLETASPDLREKILASFPGAGLRDSKEISDVVYLADPFQFGVDAWRHYRRQPDRLRWLADVAAGREP